MNDTSQLRPISITGVEDAPLNLRVDDGGDSIVIGMRTSQLGEHTTAIQVSMELSVDDLAVLERLRDRLGEMIEAQRNRLAGQPRYTARYVGDLGEQQGTKLPDDGTKDTVLIMGDHEEGVVSLSQRVEGRDRSRLTTVLRESGFRIVGESVEDGYDVFRLVRLPKQV